MTRQSTIDHLIESLTEIAMNAQGAYFGSYGGGGTGWVLIGDREGWFRRDLTGGNAGSVYHAGPISLLDISDLTGESFDAFFSRGGVRRDGESEPIFTGPIAYAISDCSEESWAIVRGEELKAIREIFGESIQLRWEEMREGEVDA